MRETWSLAITKEKEYEVAEKRIFWHPTHGTVPNLLLLFYKDGSSDHPKTCPLQSYKKKYSCVSHAVMLEP